MSTAPPGEDARDALDVVLGVVATARPCGSSSSSRPRFSLGWRFVDTALLRKISIAGCRIAARRRSSNVPSALARIDVAVALAVGERRLSVGRDVEVVLPELRHHLVDLAGSCASGAAAATLVVGHEVPARLDLGTLSFPRLEAGVGQLRPPCVDPSRSRSGTGPAGQLPLEPLRVHHRACAPAWPAPASRRRRTCYEPGAGRRAGGGVVRVLPTVRVRRRGGGHGDGRGRDGAADESAPARRRSGHGGAPE